MISKKGEFSVAGGTWSTTQQTSRRTVGIDALYLT